MDNLEAGMAELNIDTKKIRQGLAFVVVNEKFKYHENRIGAHRDKINIMKFCDKAKFTVNKIDTLKLENTNGLNFDSRGGLKTDNLTKKEMDDLFKTISKGDFSSYDAFICFISSHGGAGGILGCDGETIPLQYIVDQFKASPQLSSLTDKPKLFFTQNCRGSRSDLGVPGPRSGDDVVVDNGCVAPVTIPREADILVAYSSVDGYKSYRNESTGSWFITMLTKVFNKHAHNTNLTDMLAIVNKEVGKKVSNEGRKQMPCFLTTLRMAVCFDVSEASESPSRSSSQEPPAVL